MATVNRRAPPSPSRPTARTAGIASRPARAAPVDPILARIQEEEERSAARREAQESMSGMPFRFFCPVGETRELIVVDDRPTFVRHEHNLKDSRGKWSIYCACIAEHANCPVCLSNPDKQAYFAMYLTVIDLTPYVNKDGIEVPWSKKLLVVKSGQQKKFIRKLEQHDTLRGALFSMSRDGDKEAAIGSDIELIEFLDEDQLAEYVKVYKDKNGKDVEIIGAEPYDYEALFPEQTEEMLAALVGGHTHNMDSHNRAIGRGTGRAAPRGDDWQEPAPRRGVAPPARGPASRGPAARPAPRTRAPEPEAEVEDEVQEEEEAPQRPVGRPAPRTVAAAPSRATTRRAVEPEYEDPPQRSAPATSLADKRRQLRR